MAEMEKRFAYQAWICSTCNNETVKLAGNYHCEVCGYDYDEEGRV